MLLAPSLISCNEKAKRTDHAAADEALRSFDYIQIQLNNFW